MSLKYHVFSVGRYLRGYWLSVFLTPPQGLCLIDAPPMRDFVDLRRALARHDAPRGYTQEEQRDFVDLRRELERHDYPQQLRGATQEEQRDFMDLRRALARRDSPEQLRILTSSSLTPAEHPQPLRGDSDETLFRTLLIIGEVRLKEGVEPPAWLDRRRALDGQLYTLGEFRWWYGEQRGMVIWDEARPKLDDLYSADWTLTTNQPQPELTFEMLCHLDGDPLSAEF